MLSGSDAEGLSACERSRKNVMASDPTDEARLANAMDCLQECAGKVIGQTSSQSGQLSVHTFDLRHPCAGSAVQALCPKFLVALTSQAVSACVWMPV